MISVYQDVTAKFNTAKKVVLDISGYDYVVIHAIGPTGTINIQASLDPGDVQGTSDGNAASAANFSAVQATKLADGTAVTAIAAAGLYRVAVVGRFLFIGDGVTAAATKLVVMLTKID